MAILDGDTFGEALAKSWRTGINPGGEVAAAAIPLEHVPPADYRLRLLDRSEAVLAGRY